VTADRVPVVPVVVDPEVLAGLEAVRDSGLTNMFDRPAVARLAMDAGYYATALWVTENRAADVAGVCRGFAVVAAPPRGVAP
jgi:hypothetical protein